MGLLTIDDLKAGPVFKSERVPVPERGGDLMVRDFAGIDRDRVVQFLHDNKIKSDAGLNNWEFMLLVLTLSLCNEDGSRLIADDQVEVIGRFGSDVIRRLYDVAARINWLAPETQDAAVKNSGSGQSSDSGTASPDTSAAA